MIPRFEDDNGVPYELYWECTQCGWSITVNNYRIGRDNCILCGAKTKQLRVDYPHEKTRDIYDVVKR